MEAVLSLTRLLQFVAITVLVGAVTGCPPKYENKDGVYSSATLLPAVKDFPDPDGVDSEKGDTSDWKYVEPGEDGRGHLVLSVGDAFSSQNRHGLSQGAVTVKNKNAETLATAAIVSGKKEYVLEFDVKKGDRVFIAVEAKSGKAPYRLTFQVKDDACKDCTDEEVCKNNQCQEPILPPAAIECDPECKRGTLCVKGRPDKERTPECIKTKERKPRCPNECQVIFQTTRKFLKINYGDNPKALAKKMEFFNSLRATGQPDCASRCEEGKLSLTCLSGINDASKIDKCKVPCGGPCKRRYRCDEDSDRCVRSGGGSCKSCKNVTCGTKKKCRCGKCIKVKGPAPADCTPACKSGWKCDKAANKCNFKKLPNIRCKIINVTPAGSKAHLLLSRGAAHKVVKGDSGSVSGVGSFIITKVFANRSKATIKASSTKLAGKRSCIINRKGWKP